MDKKPFILRIVGSVIDLQALKKTGGWINRHRKKCKPKPVNRRSLRRVGLHLCGVLAVTVNVLMQVSRLVTLVSVVGVIGMWAFSVPIDWDALYWIIGLTLVLHLVAYYFRPVTIGRKFYNSVF